MIKSGLSTTSQGGVAGGERTRTLGKLHGRRVQLHGNVLQIPNTPPGRALAALLTGGAAPRTREGTLAVDCHATGDIAELVSLLMSIGLSTQDKDELPTDLSPVLQELLSFGIRTKQAVRLAADPWVTVERVKAWIGYASHMHSRGRVTSPTGLVITSLEEHAEAPSGSWSQPTSEVAVTFDDNCEYRPLPEPEYPELHEPLDGSDRSPADIWQTTRGELAYQIERDTFNNSLAQARLIAYDTQTCTYTLAVHNPYTCDWLEKRLKKVIQRTLDQVAGRPVNVAFVVQDG